MFADVAITTVVLRDVLVIPEKSVRSDQEQPFVFVALRDGRFQKRVVKPGQEEGDRVQVIDGLKAGDKIVTDGSFILKSELLKGDIQDND